MTTSTNSHFGVNRSFLGFQSIKHFTQSHSPRLGEGGRDLLRASCPTSSSSSVTQMGSQHPKGWRFHNFSGQPATVLGDPHRAEVFPDVSKLQMHLELGRFSSQARVVCPKRGLRTSFPKGFSQLRSALSQRDTH